MPVTPQMLEMANLFRAQLLARERRAATALVRYYGTTWQRIQTEAMRLEADARATRDAGEEVSEARIWQMERMQELQRQTEQELARFAPFADSTIQAGQREAIAAAQRQAPQLVAAAFPRGAALDVQFGAMHAEAIEALIGVMQDGSPMLGVLEKYVGDASERMQSTLVTDIALGFGPRKVAADIRREFGMGLSNALRLSRTEQLRAYRTATLASFQADPTVKGWERAAALDSRTCLACLLLDGTLYSTQDEMDDHPQGRCTMLPVTKTFREMGLDVDEPDFSRELGKDWFERQDEATQRAMMGPGKFDAWQAGQFKLGDIPKKIESSVWGNSWVPRSLRDLAPGWTGGGGAGPVAFMPSGIPISGALDISSLPGARSKIGGAVRHTLDVIDSVHGDGNLPTIPVKQNAGKVTTGGYVYNPYTGKAAWIQVSRHSGAPHITTAHEVGHFLSAKGYIPGSLPDADAALAALKKVLADTEAAARLAELSRQREVVRQWTNVAPSGRSRTMNVTYRVDRQFIRYLQSDEERFARGYAQYVAEKSGDPVMLAELDAALKPDPDSGAEDRLYPTQWEAEDFVPVSRAFDTLFETLGWVTR